MSLQMQHGYKRLKNGQKVLANWRLLKIEEDGSVRTIGKLSHRVAAALKSILSYGD